MTFLSTDAVLQVTPFAIFGGRGARNQHSPFHQAFLNEKDRLRVQYLVAKTNAEKRILQEQLIQWVTFQGGEFYVRNERGSYDVMTNKEKLKKSAQALREKRKKKRPSYLNMNVPVPQIIHTVSHDNSDFEIYDTINFDAETIDSYDENLVPFTDDCVASCNTLLKEIDADSLKTFPLSMYEYDEVDELSESWPGSKFF